MPAQKAPRKPRESDPAVQLRRARQLARTFLAQRILSDSLEPDPGRDVTSYVQELYDAGGLNAYLAWAIKFNPIEADSESTRLEIEACFAGYVFGLAVGSQLGPHALPIGGVR